MYKCKNHEVSKNEYLRCKVLGIVIEMCNEHFSEDCVVCGKKKIANRVQ